MRTCNYCGQPLPTHRMGAKLTPMQGRIFDLVQRSGDDGIDSESLRWILKMNRKTLKSHVYNINGELQLCDYRIYGRAGRVGVYRLVREAA